MGKHPLLGVGIGNFPVVLALNPSASKAGASAHNLYLNFFAELGVLGFVATSLFIVVIIKKDGICLRAVRMIMCDFSRSMR